MDPDVHRATDRPPAPATAPGPALLRLDRRGTILEGSPGAEALLGCRSQDLAGRHLSQLVTYLAKLPLVVDGRLDSRLAYLSRCGFAFEVACRDGRRIAAELYFSAPTGDWSEGVNLIMRPKEGDVGEGEAARPLVVQVPSATDARRLRVA